MKTDKTPAIFLRGRRSPYHNLSTRIPASFHVFLDGVPFLYFRESARVQSFKCCIVLTRAQMEIHHVLFTASKKHYTLPPVPQRRRPAPGVFFDYNSISFQTNYKVIRAGEIVTHSNLIYNHAQTVHAVILEILRKLNVFNCDNGNMHEALNEIFAANDYCEPNAEHHFYFQ